MKRAREGEEALPPGEGAAAMETAPALGEPAAAPSHGSSPQGQQAQSKKPAGATPPGG